MCQYHLLVLLLLLSLLSRLEMPASQCYWRPRAWRCLLLLALRPVNIVLRPWLLFWKGQAPLFQSVDVVMETPDPEVILPGKFPTVVTRPLVRLCDPLAVTLPLHSTPLEPPSSQETPVRFGTQHISPVSGQSPCPPVLSPQIPFLQPTLPVYRKLTWVTNRNHTVPQKFS